MSLLRAENCVFFIRDRKQEGSFLILQGKILKSETHVFFSQIMKIPKMRLTRAIFAFLYTRIAKTCLNCLSFLNRFKTHGSKSPSNVSTILRRNKSRIAAKHSRRSSCKNRHLSRFSRSEEDAEKVGDGISFDRNWIELDSAETN